MSKKIVIINEGMLPKEFADYLDKSPEVPSEVRIRLPRDIPYFFSETALQASGEYEFRPGRVEGTLATVYVDKKSS